MQILRHNFTHKLILVVINLTRKLRIKTNTLFSNTISNNFVQSNKCTTADKEDVLRVNMNELLTRMLSAPLWRNTCIGAFQNFKKRLLYTFTRYIACNREVFCFTSNFVDLVDVYNTHFCARNVTISGSNELKQNVFDVFANITSFGKRCGIGNCKRNFQKTRKGLRK
ncbi:Uncharacterised protein [Chlamydia trachomatis]|nr:Uncharacterised protein [Chlamydia trachomatis]